MPRETKKNSSIITVYIPLKLINKVKNIVYWTPGLTIAGFAEKAINDAVYEMEQERGKAFKKRR